MKLNLKSTIAAPADNKSCQKALNGIIGNTKRGIVIDKTLDPDSNNPVANKPVSTALAALAGQLAKGQVVFLDQLPESGEPHKVYVLTATNQRYWWDGNAFVKIVPTDIKDSVTIKHTLVDNKISLDLDEAIKEKINAAGGSVSPTLNLLDISTDFPTVRTSITEEEKQNIEKGLYNSVLYYDDSLGDAAMYSIYFPENAICIDGALLFSIYKLVVAEDGEGSIASTRVYSLNIEAKNSNGTYPITIESMMEAPFGSGDANLPILDLSAYNLNADTVLTDAQITAIEDYGTNGVINIKLPEPFNTIPATLNKGFVVKKDGVNYKNSFIEIYSTPVPYLLNDLFPIIALFDMRYIITDEKKLKMEYVALPKKDGAGDGFLTWNAKENKMVWKPLSTIIPIVEGTEAQLTDEERNTGITSKYTIPAAQTSPFILHSNDIGYILVDISAYDESVAYCGITAIDRNNWALISGSDTTVYISGYQPVSLYPIQIDHFPYDETTSVDINFPLIDMFYSVGCLVADLDVSRVFIKNGNDIWGSFQTPIIYGNDGKYRYWYISTKPGGDIDNKLAVLKCKVVNIGGPTATITFED